MWKFVKYCSFISIFILFISAFGMNSAPQQAAGAALAIGLAVIPYCLARANAELEKEQEPKEMPL